MTIVVPDSIPPFPGKVEAFPDEAAYGLLFRTATHNGMRRPRLLLKKLGWRDGMFVAHLDPVSVARVCKTDADLLRNASPVFTSKTATLMGETLHRDHFGGKKRRWCPACLAEAPYARVWWDILPVTTCPIHHVELVSRCRCNRTLHWQTHLITACDKGDQLADVPTRQLSPEECMADAYIVARLNGWEHPGVPALDGVSLEVAISAMQNVGRASLAAELDLSQARRRVGIRPLINEGFRCLSDMTGAFQDLLDRLRHSPVGSRTSAGIAHHYGPLYYWILSLKPSSLGQAVNAAVSAHVSRNHLLVKGGTKIGGRALCLDLLPVEEAAAAAGITEEWFNALAMELGYRPKRRSHGQLRLYSDEQVRTIRTMVEGTIKVTDLPSELAVTQRSVRVILSLGLLKILPRPLSWKEAKRCSRQDVSRLYDILRAAFAPLDESADQRLEPIAAASIGTPGGLRQLLMWILNGQVAVRRIDEQAAGLHKFLVSRDEVSALGYPVSNDVMSANHAAKVLGMHKTALEELLHAQIMTATLEGRNWRLTQDDIDQFNETYVRATELAKLAGVSSSNTLRSLMQKQGVRPCCAKPKFRQSLYRRSEAMPVIQQLAGRT